MVTKKRQSIAYYLFAGLSISAIAFSLVGYLGRLNLYFEFASGYKLQFLLMALCGLVYFLLTFKRFWIFINLCCVLLNLGVILPWYFNRPQIINLEQYQPLKVLSYNVLWSNKKYQKAIALVNQEQPNIAIFQEAVPHWHTELKALESNYPYHIRAERLEIEVYSKLPLNQTEVRLYGTYRGLVISEIKIGARLIKFVATHAYPQLYFGHKGWQIRNQHLEVGIGEYVADLSQPVIILGDLNVSMWSPFYHSMIKQSGLRNARQGLGILPTQSTVAPQFAILSAPIDHCLVSPEIQVKNFKLGQAIGSDHLPIVAELLIPQY
ncbi:MAG: endonuclease/exonuclease/phosphatase family protein [Cyanobacteria bacterium P01_E01_bin.35]